MRSAWCTARDNGDVAVAVDRVFELRGATPPADAEQLAATPQRDRLVMTCFPSASAAILRLISRG
jgi:hypothetical protein